MPTKRLRLVDLGRRISFARQKAGLTQGALARAVDVSAMSISRYERGQMGPGPVVLAAIVVACGCGANWLLGISMTEAVT